MKLIATVDNRLAIGHQGGRLVRIPSDEKFFRFETMHKAVIMGRVAMENFPSGQPPRDRTNIILTRKSSLPLSDVIVVHSVEEALKEASAFADDDVYVIGGASVFEQFLPYCNEAFITKIDYDYDADRFFPDLDKSPEWELVDESEEQTYYDLVYVRCHYVRKKNA